MIGVVTDSTFYGVIARKSVSNGRNQISKADLRCTKADTALAALDSTGQLLDPTRLQTDVFPAFVQGLLHFVGDIYHLRGRNDIIPPMDEAIKHLVEPEAVF